MKLTINIDCTPQEARTFFGLPDVEALNKAMVDEMTKRAKENMEQLSDPEKFFQTWTAMTGKGFESFQNMMGAAMTQGMGPGMGSGADKKK